MINAAETSHGFYKLVASRESMQPCVISMNEHCVNDAVKHIVIIDPFGAKFDIKLNLNAAVKLGRLLVGDNDLERAALRSIRQQLASMPIHAGNVPDIKALITQIDEVLK